MRTGKLAVAMVWMAASGTCYGAQPVSAQSVGKVLVCINSDNYGLTSGSVMVLTRAEDITSRMFKSAGVALEWRSAGSGACRKPQRTQAVILDFATNTPASQSPGALAYALPYEGIHIVVMFDRILKKASDPAQVSALLAHVMTREITHILQGIAHHSEAGVMKARWDSHDFLQMRQEPLPFTPEDLALIERAPACRGRNVRRTFSRQSHSGVELVQQALWYGSRRIATSRGLRVTDDPGPGRTLRVFLGYSSLNCGLAPAAATCPCTDRPGNGHSGRGQWYANALLHIRIRCGTSSAL